MDEKEEFERFKRWWNTVREVVFDESLKQRAKSLDLTTNGYIAWDSWLAAKRDERGES